MLRQVVQIADRTAKANTDLTLVPGLEAVAWIATDLARLTRPSSAERTERNAAERRRDVEARHSQALHALLPASLLGIADAAFTEAAELGRVLQPTADAEAVAHLRTRLTPFAPRLVARRSDAEILKVVEIYRRRRARRGRPVKGENVANQDDRSEALADFLEMRSRDGGEPDRESVSNQLTTERASAAERVRRLTGYSAKKDKAQPVPVSPSGRSGDGWPTSAMKRAAKKTRG
jgi:hypothetical protein